jgi:hypothetical protein
LKLKAASAEEWNDLENHWVEYFSWFDPNCTRFMNFKEYHLQGSISNRCPKCALDFLLKVGAAREVVAEDFEAQEVEAEDTISRDAIKKEAAEEDEWEDI